MRILDRTQEGEFHCDCGCNDSYFLCSSEYAFCVENGPDDDSVIPQNWLIYAPD